jgi:hypothetical protein
MPAKGEERKVEVTASCDSYPLPIQEAISLLTPPPFPTLWREAVGNGGGRGAPGNWGFEGEERERDQRRHGSQAAGAEQQGENEGEGKRRRGIRSV